MTPVLPGRCWPQCRSRSPGPTPERGQGFRCTADLSGVTALDHPLDESLHQRPARPMVSVAVAMLNEADHVLACLRAFEHQTWPDDLLDVMVIDGGSTDGSRAMVEAFAATRPWIRVLDNPAGHSAAAWNVGLRAARGDCFGIFSSHGVPSPGFVEASVEALRDSGAAGVGGRYLHRGTDPTASGIGLAMSSPFGMASPHRSATEAADVDTISHPIYWTDRVRAIGGFDETLLRNEDYELNWRLRSGGDVLRFDPRIESVYRPRASLRALARQFWWYGQYKSLVMRRHPGATRLRHLVPPAAALGAAVAPVLVWWRPGRWVVGAGAVSYLALDALATKRTEPALHHASPSVVARAFPVMHFSWGFGVLAGLVRRPRG